MNSSSIKLKLTGMLVVLFVILGSMSLYIVKESEYALKFRFRKIESVQLEPGLYWMFPFIENVTRVDARIQTVDLPPEMFLTVEKKNVLVDSFVKWKVFDVNEFYKGTKGNFTSADSRLSQTIIDAIKGQFSQRSVQEVVSGERTQIMNVVKDAVDIEARKLGITIVDVRIKRVDFSEKVSESIFKRMVSERESAAADFRFRGQEEAQKLRAAADRQRAEILAEAYNTAESIRGEGDAIATDTYAKAFGRNAEFYSFYRSINAYKSTFSRQNNFLVIEPNSEFFQYFKNPRGKNP